jgi:hypothetical protein
MNHNDGILGMDLPAEHQIKGKQTSAIIAPISAEPTPAMTILVKVEANSIKLNNRRYIKPPRSVAAFVGIAFRYMPIE